MQIKDILKIEKQRGDSSSKRVIHLFKEGSFLRAYEWSAWLCCRFISDFKATHKMMKSMEQSTVFVGFPTTSLPKFTPEGSHVQEIEGGSIVLSLSAEMILSSMDEPPVMKYSPPGYKAYNLMQRSSVGTYCIRTDVAGVPAAERSLRLKC